MSRIVVLTILAAWAAAPRLALAVTIETVSVGDTGNVGEVQFNGTFGAVAYKYRIGTTEVTNAQYAEFLNAKATSDPLGLYNTDMGNVPRGGITRSGVSGSFTYTTKANMGNKPVNLVNWYDAIRFANWLHNGQGSGDTETGAYTLLGGTPTPSNGLSIMRNAGTTWVLTSADEWYKAAYYDPTLSSGSGGYWDYPTQSNAAPTAATANSVGDISNPGTNVANYLANADWNGLDGNVTTVGSAGPLSASHYGTSDQGGNVWEWTDSIYFHSARDLRGGSWATGPLDLLPSDNVAGGHTLESNNVGFRVALVPEPSTIGLAALGFASLIACAWRRRRI